MIGHADGIKLPIGSSDKHTLFYSTPELVPCTFDAKLQMLNAVEIL